MKPRPREDLACGSCRRFEATGVKRALLFQPYLAPHLGFESFLYFQSAFRLLLTHPLLPQPYRADVPGVVSPVLQMSKLRPRDGVGLPSPSQLWQDQG